MDDSAFNLQLCSLSDQLKAQCISPAEVAARLIVLHQYRRHGVCWLSGPRRPVVGAAAGGLLPLLDSMAVNLSSRRREQLSPLSDMRSLYSGFLFRGVVQDAHEGALGWLEGSYPLVPLFSIPTPDAMLEVQCQGKRFVTLLLDPSEQWKSRGRHRDACAFLLHDFEHAHKFFATGNSHRGQRRFFSALRDTLAAFARWSDDSRFVADLDYLKSDMNSHPVHLMKYLKAIVLNAEIRRSGLSNPDLLGFWRELFVQWRMRKAALAAALKINQPALEAEGDRIVVRDFFMPDEGEVHRAGKNRQAVFDTIV